MGVRVVAIVLMATAGGVQVFDQDHPVVEISYRPPASDSKNCTPLLLLGGMGPLAGAQALERALATLRAKMDAGESQDRDVILLQATCIPDRTSAIVASGMSLDLTASPSDLHSAGQACTTHEECVQVSHTIACSLAAAEALLPWEAEAADLVVTCNTAHFFTPAALDMLREDRPTAAARFSQHSLIEGATAAAVAAVGGSGGGAFIMASSGTLMTGLYSFGLDQEGIKSLVPPTPKRQAGVMGAINSVKGADTAAVVAHATPLFQALRELEAGPPAAVIAGCTEDQQILATLRTHEDVPKEVRDFVSSLQVIEPVEAVFNKVV